MKLTYNEHTIDGEDVWNPETDFYTLVNAMRNNSDELLDHGHSPIYAEEGDPDFFGTNNVDEAIELARTGWDAGIKKLAPKLNANNYKRPRTRRAVAGARPNVPRAIMGMPDSMVRYEPTKRKSNAPLRIYTRLNCPGHYDADMLIEYAKLVMEKVVEYDSEYDVELWSYAFSYHNNKNTIIAPTVCIKRSGSRFVTNNVAFGFHPAFYRRMLWRLYDTCPKRNAYGYGAPATSKAEDIPFLTKHARGKRAVRLTAVSEWKPGSKIKATSLE